ncbi:hypothetical protein CHUAL_008477 [Chamberlinius hualienensis]
MATNELGPAKTVVIIAVVIGCFAMLWPKVFYPMMQTVFMITRPKGFNQEKDTVCCDVIYENNMDLKFFAELCHSVLDVNVKVVKHSSRGRRWRGNSPPPPGTMQRCRQKIQELCNLDINDIIAANEAAKYKVKNYRIDVSTPKAVESDFQKLNLSQCMQKYFNYGNEESFRKQHKPATLPSHIRQERLPRLGPQGHPDKGHFVHHPAHKMMPPNSQGGRTGRSGKAEKSEKSSGTYGLLMPVYTIGISAFFIYTIAKFFVKKTEKDSSKPKLNDFHMDPDYRKYVLSEEYHDGHTISYEEYLTMKEQGQLNDKHPKLLSNGHSKQVKSETDELLGQPVSLLNEEDSRLDIDDDTADLQTAAEELPLEDKAQVKVEGPLSELAEHLKQLIQQDHAKIAVMGLETVADFPVQQDTLPHIETEVSNIVLEKAVPADSKLLVAESECLTHTSVEHIDGWSEADDEDTKPVIVTGKMTISLLGNEQAAVLNAQQSTPEEDVETDNEIDKAEDIDEEVLEQQPVILTKELNGKTEISS